ncbi:MAG: hypothetical protein ABEK59_08255 [Halobacteria archaeon]
MGELDKRELINRSSPTLGDDTSLYEDLIFPNLRRPPDIEGLDVWRVDPEDHSLTISSANG